MTTVDQTATDELPVDDHSTGTVVLSLTEGIEGESAEPHRFITAIQDSIQRQVEDSEWDGDEADLIIPAIHENTRNILEVIDGGTEENPGYYLIPKDVDAVNIAGSLAALFDDINS